MSTLISPFAIDNIDEAYTAYCAMPFLKRKDRKKPTKAQFKKLYTQRRIERNGAAVAEAKGDAPADLMQAFAEWLAAQGKGEAIHTEARKPIKTAPKDAARNGVLWRLNVEGLLSEALAASDESYITQKAGQDTLTAAFGPLS